MTELDFIGPIAARLMDIPGVQAVVLGGSRGRGAAPPDSDYDLGLYYERDQPFDLAALNALCRELDDSGDAEATPPGGWGPWVDGGAWLTIRGQRVDFIYRELGRLQTSVEDALAGRVSLHAQTGHPHGIYGHHYAAELATCRVLIDPDRRLDNLKVSLGAYPEALRSALIAHYGWQPGFWLDAATKGLTRGDLVYVQGCTFQAVMAMVQRLCAQAGVWITNEKGALALASGVPGAPPEFAGRVNAALSATDLDGLRALSQAVSSTGK
jgi:Nucleotidyltransferase domain